MLATIIPGLLLIQGCFSIIQPHDETSIKNLFAHTGACNTQHGRELDDPDYYASNSGMPHDPSSSGFIATHGTHRFFAMHEQTAMLVGEGKHGVWRFQENGFIRIYRGVGKEGIPPQKREGVRDLRENIVIDDDMENKESAWEINRLLIILERNYMPIDPNFEFNHQFGEEVFEPNGRNWLNWIDLPIYHARFGGKYKEHVPIDLPVYYCQMSSAEFPHMGATWHVMKAQPKANIVGPLGRRGGMDIRENFNDVIRFRVFDDAGFWANIGQGNPETDKMAKTLEELKERAQTANWQRIDKDKIDWEVYVMERSYHNAKSTYLSLAFVMIDPKRETEYTYIRPHGEYYNYLVEKGYEIKSTTPNNSPKVPIENETELKEAYGLATYGHHHMARVKYGLGGGACPQKGGDVSVYPWGDAGSGWPTNYEEITPLCDAFLVDIKLWVNLDKQWNEADMFLGNAGHDYRGQEAVMYQAQANWYGKYSDSYNVERGAKNPYELDWTEDHKIQEFPEQDEVVPVVNFTIDFGVVGEVQEYFNTEIDWTPRTCLADEIEDKDGPVESPVKGAAGIAAVSVCILAIVSFIWV